MPRLSPNPVPAFNFMVTMTDIIAGFSDCSGLDAEMEIETYHEGGQNDRLRKFFKAPRFPNIVLKRGITFNGELWDWYQSVVQKPHTPVRKDGVIVLLDRGLLGQGGVLQRAVGLPGLDRTPVAAWAFQRGLPERVQGPQLSGNSDEIAIETLEISHEGLQRLSPSMIPGGVVDAALTVASATAARLT